MSRLVLDGNSCQRRCARIGGRYTGLAWLIRTEENAGFYGLIASHDERPLHNKVNRSDNMKSTIA